MTTGAITSAPLHGVLPGSDRIDVLDESGVLIGWVDPATGLRNLLAADRAADFDEMIDFWLAAAGLSDRQDADSPASPAEGPARMQVSEIRYPDPEVVRSLVIPLLPLP
jgi:hypothetical protein